MKFSPETLLQIYLDGSFTEEAQAEFDALMRKDPSFAERVTRAVSERLGPVPDASVEAIASRLDTKVSDLWVKHKPSPWTRSLRLGLKALTALSLGVVGIWGFHHWISMTPAPDGQDQTRTTALTDKAVRERGLSTGKVGAKRHSAVKPSAQEEVVEEQAGTQAAGEEERVQAVSAPKSQTQGDQAPAVKAVPKTKGSMTSAQGDALRVAVHSDKTRLATITVYDGNGNLVRHLFQGTVQAGDRYVDWDGKNDLGGAVTPGSYNVVLDLDGKKMSGVLKILPK